MLAHVCAKSEKHRADLGSLCKCFAACRRDDDRRDGGMQREEKPMDFDVVSLIVHYAEDVFKRTLARF
jgi:hypothetical protein